MDIQVASNFERYLYYRAGCDAAQATRWMAEFQRAGKLTLPAGDDLIRAGRGDTAATLATIRKYWTAHRYLLDPHSAVGVCVAERHLDPAVPMICLATAHPAKFGDAIRQAIGEDLAHHPILDALAALPTRCARLPAERAAVAAFIANAISGLTP